MRSSLRSARPRSCAARQQRQDVVAVLPLRLGHVDLDAVVEAEDALDAVALPQQVVERREQRRPMRGHVERPVQGGRRGVGRLGPALDVHLHDLAVSQQPGQRGLDLVDRLEAEVVGHLDRGRHAQSRPARAAAGAGWPRAGPGRACRVRPAARARSGRTAAQSRPCVRLHISSPWSSRSSSTSLAGFQSHHVPRPPRGSSKAAGAQRTLGAHALEHQRIQRGVLGPNAAATSRGWFAHAHHARQEVAVLGDGQPRGHVAPVLEAALVAGRSTCAARSIEYGPSRANGTSRWLRARMLTESIWIAPSRSSRSIGSTRLESPKCWARSARPRASSADKLAPHCSSR